jgi:hypothetical protein
VVSPLAVVYGSQSEENEQALPPGVAMDCGLRFSCTYRNDDSVTVR